MPCALTQNYLVDCKDAVGGITEVYFMASADVTSYTEASGVITALVKASGKKFFKYQLVKETSSLVENITPSVENGTLFTEQVLTIILNKLQVNTRNEIMLLAKNLLVAVVKDSNDKYWYLGAKRGIDMTPSTGQTGTAFGDRSGYSLVFTGKEPDMAQEVSSGVAAVLTTAGA